MGQLSYIIFLLGLLLSNTCFAQDTIYTKLNGVIEAKVIESSADVVRYKKAVNLDGPTYSINKIQVIKIVMADGSIVLFEDIKVVALDTIYTKRKGMIEAKILELSTDVIRYKKAAYLEGPTYSINKTQVTKVAMADGSIVTFEDRIELVDSTYYNHRKIIKIDPLGLRFHYLGIGYEQMINEKRSWEVALTFGGVGFNRDLLRGNNNNHSGAIRVGLKLLKKKQTIGKKYPNPLSRNYLRIDASYAISDLSSLGNSSGQYYSPQSLALTLSGGSQFAVAPRLCVNFNAGLGITYSQENRSFNNLYLTDTDGLQNHLANFVVFDPFGIAVDVGITIGYLLK